MRQFRRLPLALPLVAALCAPALAHNHSHDEGHGHSHGAHEHGVSQLDAVLEGNTLELSLTGPAHNFVGFEHAPQTDAQRKAIQQARDTLKNGAALFVIAPAAGCSLDDADIDAEHGAASDKDHGKSHAHDHGHAHDHADDDEAHAHRDYRAEYRFTCTQPAALKTIDVGVFRAFDQTTEIRLQLAAPGAQSGGTLTPQDHVITLP